MFPVTEQLLERHIPNATDATNQVLLIAPFDMKLVSVSSRHRVASTSGTLDIVKAASATALSAGTSLLDSTMSLSGTADTTVNADLKDGDVGETIIPKGSALGLVFAGTLTNLADLDITFRIRQVRKY